MLTNIEGGQLVSQIHSSWQLPEVNLRLLTKYILIQNGVIASGTHRQITAGLVMVREAGITSFTK